VAAEEVFSQESAVLDLARRFPLGNCLSSAGTRAFQYKEANADSNKKNISAPYCSTRGVKGVGKVMSKTPL